jgi:hypothetical protein
MFAQKSKIIGVNNVGSASITVPIGVFAESHLIGLSLNYWHSRTVFRADSTRQKRKIWWVGNGGIEYYLGKKETLNGNTFRFGNYSYIYATTGFSYNLFKYTTIFLVAGPSLGLYKGNADLGIRASAGLNYLVSNQIIIYSSIAYMKHGDVNALLAPGFGVGIQF